MFDGCYISNSNNRFNFIGMSAVEWLFDVMFDPTWNKEHQIKWLEKSKEKERNQIIRAVNYSVMNLEKLRKQAINERKSIGELYVQQFETLK